MKLNDKRVRFTFLIAGLLLIIFTGLFMKQLNKKNIPVDSSVKNDIKRDNNEPKKLSPEAVVKKPKKTKFKSNEEIKEEYGKIETVYLWDGRSYTGAVVTTDELYSIVTLKGVIKIPMKDVKLREIIR
jgi:hypothetical protein